MAKVYTKTGDKGETSLVSGTRVSKGSDRIKLYGDVDELNSHIGYYLSLIKTVPPLLIKVQSALFDLGSNLACEENKRDEYKLPQLGPSLIIEIESGIDEMQSSLEPLKNFILPGGSQAASYAHICRTACRRVETELIKFSLNSNENAPVNSVEFLNRLSDYFFVLSRFDNKNLGIKETVWKPC